MDFIRRVRCYPASAGCRRSMSPSVLTVGLIYVSNMQIAAITYREFFGHMASAAISRHCDSCFDLNRARRSTTLVDAS